MRARSGPKVLDATRTVKGDTAHQAVGDTTASKHDGDLKPALVATQRDMALHRSVGAEDSGQPEGEMAAGRDATTGPPGECLLGATFARRVW